MPRKHWSQMNIASIKADARRRAKKPNLQLATKGYVKKQVGAHDVNTQFESVRSSLAYGYDVPLVWALSPTGQYFYKSAFNIRFNLLYTGKNRFWIIQYLQSNKTAPTVSEILRTQNIDQYDIYQSFDYDNRSSFKVLYDSLHDTQNDDNDSVMTRHVVIPLKRLSRKSTAITDDSTTFNKGSVYLMAISDKTQASGFSSITYGVSTVVTAPKL